MFLLIWLRGREKYLRGQIFVFSRGDILICGRRYGQFGGAKVAPDETAETNCKWPTKISSLTQHRVLDFMQQILLHIITQLTHKSLAKSPASGENACHPTCGSLLWWKTWLWPFWRQEYGVLVLWIYNSASDDISKYFSSFSRCH